MQSREQLRAQIERDVRNAISDAGRAAQGAAQAGGPALAPDVTIPAPFAIDVLRGEIAATRAEIDRISAQLRPDVDGAQRQSLEGRLDQATQRLTTLQGRLDQILTGVTSSSTSVPPALPPEIPPEVKDISIWFFLTVGVTIVALAIIRPWARWLDRRGHAPPTAADVTPRLDRIEQAIEAVAIEVERISEGQRFASKLMSEGRALPAGALQEAWPASPAREPVTLRREGD